MSKPTPHERFHTVKLRVSGDFYDLLLALSKQVGMSVEEFAGNCALQGVSFVLAHAQAEAEELAVREAAADPFSIENLSKGEAL